LSFSLPGTLPKEGGLKIVALSSVFALIRSMMHNVDNLKKKRFTDHKRKKLGETFQFQNQILDTTVTCSPNQNVKLLLNRSSISCKCN
jgi:hypothetical protein